MDKFCPNCGNNVGDCGNNFGDAKFCSKCGREVETSPVPNKTISSENGTIISENNTISSENSTIISENNTINIQNNTMSSQNNTMSSQSNTMSSQNNTMSSQSNTINIQNNTMIDIPTKPKNDYAIGCSIILILFGGFFIINLIEITKLIEDTDFISSMIIVVVLLQLAVFLIVMLIINSRNAKQKLNKRARELNAKEQASFLHTVGLPIDENTNCVLYLCDDKIVIDSNNLTFNLSKEKLIDVTVKTDVEIQKNYAGSLGGAVVGGLLFGVVGALIGGRAKERKTKNVENYLIFTYEKEGDFESIAFNVTHNVKQWAFVEDFEEMLEKANKEIEL